MKITIAIILLIFSLPTFAIKVVVGDKTFYVEQYEIKNNGRTIVFKNNVELGRNLASHDCKSGTKPYRPKRRPSGFGALMKDLEGGYKQLENAVTKEPVKKSRRNFR